jgi:peptide/nickel transport system substrate-binding protein
MQHWMTIRCDRRQLTEKKGESQMKRLIALVAALAMILTGCAIGGGADDAFVFALSADIVNLTPILLTNVVSRTVSMQIHEPLVRYEGNNKLVAALATEWTQADDGLSWTFKLRPDVKWHDGEAFTAADVKYTYEALLDPSNQSVHRTNYEMIEKIETPDDLTVVFQLKESHGPFLDKVAQLPIMAEHHVPEVGFENYNMNPIGTGPFKYVEWVPNDHFTVEANAEYWGGEPALATVVFRPIPEASVRAMALSKGEIDYAAGLTAEDFAGMQDSKALTTFSIPQLTFAYLGYNNRNALFQDRRVREAMAYTIDQETIISDILKGAGRPSTGPIAPINEEWYNPDVRTFTQDFDKARQLLAEAGWTPGADGILVNSAGERFSFSVIIGSGNEQTKNQGILLQSWLAQVGIEMKLEFLDWSLMNARLDARDYEAMMLSMSPSADPDQYNYWHSSSISGGFNDWCYSNPEVDSLLEQGRRESDPAARKEIYNRVQEILAEDVATLWLYHRNELAALNSSYTGMTEEAAGQYQLLYKVQPK